MLLDLTDIYDTTVEVLSTKFMRGRDIWIIPVYSTVWIYLFKKMGISFARLFSWISDGE